MNASKIKRLITFILNQNCLIFVGFGIQITGSMEARPQSFQAYIDFGFFHGAWSLIYISAGIAGYLCFWAARYRGNTFAWMLWNVAIACPLLAFSWHQFLGVPSSTAITTYGVIWIVSMAQTFGIYECPSVVRSGGKIRGRS